MNLESLLADLRDDEGWRAHVYQDSLGFDTIGYGFLVDSRKGEGLPKEVGEFWLRHIATESLSELRRLWPAFENQPADVQLAVANMAYQLGPTGVMKFRRMLAALEAGDRETAADEAIDSEWFRQTPNRSRRVAAMLRGKLPT